MLEFNFAPIFQPQEKRSGTLKEQVAAIGPQLEELRRRKEDRARQFLEVKTEIARICAEIAGNYGEVYVPEEKDLTLRRLDEYHGQLATLQKEKVDISVQVLFDSYLYDFSELLELIFVSSRN